MARGFRQSAGRGQRLSRRWLGFQTGATFHGLSAGATATEIASEGLLRDTIMRTRGQLMCWIDGLEAPAVAVLVSVGLQVVPGGTGATVISNPFSDENADWFYFSEFVLGYEEYVVDAIQATHLSSYREIIDNKAMRIGNPDTEVQMVVVNTTINGAASINVTLSGRFLLGS